MYIRRLVAMLYFDERSDSRFSVIFFSVAGVFVLKAHKYLCASVADADPGSGAFLPP